MLVANILLRGELFFFFQAEDGIRDLIVTGVQTCALPIWRHFPPRSRPAPPAMPRAPSRPARSSRFSDPIWGQRTSSFINSLAARSPPPSPVDRKSVV